MMQFGARWKLAFIHLLLCSMLSLAGGFASHSASAASQVEAEGDTERDRQRWAAVRKHFFGDADIRDGRDTLALVAPDRAHDAAVVPVTVRARFEQTEARFVRTITLLIDQNPSPLAGRFHLTPASGMANISTRVRVNEYSNIRAVAELNDGSLHMVSTFVRAAGGCAAPAPRDFEATLANMGKMKLKRPVNELLGQPNRAKLMIRHPNYSGMQTDAHTKAYIPAEFVKEVEVRHGDTVVMRVEADISISEDPTFQFYYSPAAGADLSVSVLDTAERRFDKAFSNQP